MSRTLCAIEIPPEIEASPLYARGGFAIVPGLIAADVLADLTAEALAARPSGQRNAVAVSDGAEGRGGAPGRAFTSAHGGPLQWRIYSAPQLIAFLSQMSGLAATPTGGGSFTYYEQPGDFLALHRDIVACDLAIITCLSETRVAPGGGSLLLYPDHATQPLSTARAAGRSAATPAPLGPGDSAILLGGIVPHEVAPMQPGQQRIVSVMCYRLLSHGLTAYTEPKPADPPTESIRHRSCR
jgi:hypothetical protein